MLVVEAVAVIVQLALEVLVVVAVVAQGIQELVEHQAQQTLVVAVAAVEDTKLQRHLVLVAVAS